MAAKKPSPGMDFILRSLEKNKKASYGDIAAAAGKKRLKIYPIMFGRAQAMLGIVKQAKRGQGKAAKAKKAAAAGRPKRGPGRPRKNAAPAVAKRGPGRPRKATNALATLGSLVTAMKKSEQDKERYKKALDKISKILGEIG